MAAAPMDVCVDTEPAVEEVVGCGISVDVADGVPESLEQLVREAYAGDVEAGAARAVVVSRIQQRGGEVVCLARVFAGGGGEVTALRRLFRVGGDEASYAAAHRRAARAGGATECRALAGGCEVRLGGASWRAPGAATEAAGGAVVAATAAFAAENAGSSSGGGGGGGGAAFARAMTGVFGAGGGRQRAHKKTPPSSLLPKLR